MKLTSEKKAVFFDIDGTIWDERQQIPDSTREALRKLNENGHYLFLSSGRTRIFIPDQKLMPLGFHGIVGGCGTYGEFQGEVKFYHKIPLEQIQAECRFLNRLDASYLLEGRHYIYLDLERYPQDDPFPVRMKQSLGDRLLPIRGNEERLEVSKFCVNRHVRNQKELEQELGRRYEVYHREEEFMEIVPKGINKATGIEEICRILGILHENTYAFGDSTNDLDMLRFAAHSVAMGDGMQEAKEAAEYVTAGLWEDGIQKGLEHYGLL